MTFPPEGGTLCQIPFQTAKAAIIAAFSCGEYRIRTDDLPA
jgi:hypothetical protein